MSKIKLSDYVAKRLKEHGVKHFFMVSGGGAMHLNDSLGRIIPYTANHHEQACSIAAEGYARVNQDLAVVNVTTGPGGLNCLNGVFGQWTDSVPVLYISGQVKYTTTMASCPDIPLRQLGDQEVDIISVVKPLTKFAQMVTEPNKIKYYIDKAIYEATSGRKGPVWLDIPMNVQGAIIEENDLIEFTEQNYQSINTEKNIQDCKEILSHLKNAKRPLIIAGHGIRLSNQINNFKQLIEQLKLPVVTTFNGFDLMEDSNPYYVGRIGTIGQRAGNFALQNADVVLCLGTRNNIRQASYNYENFAKNSFRIIVDIDKAELDKPTIKPDFAICADLKNIIPELLNQSTDFENTENFSDWLNFCKKLQNKYSKIEQEQKEVIEPYHFTHCLTDCLKENDIFVMANGSACVCTFQNAVVKKGQRFILNSGNASMGYALPAVIGAYYNNKDNQQNRSVVCLEGDGSIMMNIQELQTIAFNKLPIKLFVINNSGYSSIRQTQRNFFNGHMTGSGMDSGVSVPDFVELGKVFGFRTKRIENPNTMEKEIKEILESNEAIICEVMVEKEYGFAPKLSARKLDDGTMVSPSLEDMYPFLDRNEYKENIYEYKK